MDARMTEEINNNVDNRCNDIIVELGLLSKKVDELTAIVHQMVKTPATKKATAARSASGKKGVAAASAGPAKFPVNRLLWFRKEYPSGDGVYRNKVLKEVEGLEDAIENDPNLAKQTNEDQKLKMESSFAYDWIKNNAEDYMKTIRDDYLKAKSNFTTKSRPEPLEVEKDTDDETSSVKSTVSRTSSTRSTGSVKSFRSGSSRKAAKTGGSSTSKKPVARRVRPAAAKETGLKPVSRRVAIKPRTAQAKKVATPVRRKKPAPVINDPITSEDEEYEEEEHDFDHDDEGDDDYDIDLHDDNIDDEYYVDE